VAASGVVWWELESADPVGTQRFYGELFGWTFERAFENSELDREYWLIRSDGRSIGGLQAARPGAPPPQAGTRLYVEVDDLEATLARAELAGATVERGRTFLGSDDFWFANVLDPQGISLGLWTSKPEVTR
jgi:predicted enzyme related to lactoylglutathione lyase